MNNKKTQIYTFMALFLVLIIDAMGIGLVLPLIGPLFISRTSAFVAFNMSIPIRDILYGVTMASFCVFMFFGAPFLGDLSDHLGRKKVLLMCLFGTALGLAISAIGVDFDSITLLIAGRTVAGFMAGSQALAQAAIIDISDKNNKAKNLSLISLASCLGFVMGPILAGVTSNKALWSGFSFATPFWIAAALAIINGLALLFTFRETFHPKPKQRIKLTRGAEVFISAFTNKLVRKLALIYLLAELGWALYFQFIPLLLINAYQYSAAQISHYMAWMGVVFAFTFLVIVRIIEKYIRVEKTVIPSLLLTAVGILMLLTHNTVILWLSAIPTCIGGALFYVALLTKFSNAVDENHQGWAMGVFAALVAVAWSVGGMSSGILGIFTVYIPFVIAGGLLLLSSILAIKS